MIINTKSIARTAACQAMYHCQVTSQWHNIERVIDWLNAYYDNKKQLFDDLELSSITYIKLHRSYHRTLILLTIDNLSLIDQIVLRYLTQGRSMVHVGDLLLSILRVAIAELRFTTTPHKVVINEFTSLSANFGFDAEVNFINSILDKIGKHHLESNA